MGKGRDDDGVLMRSVGGLWLGVVLFVVCVLLPLAAAVDGCGCASIKLP